MIRLITHQLLELYHKQRQPVVIGLCGAADVGKSTLAAAVVEKLRKKRYTADHFSLDTFLLDRKTRLAMGLSGYEAMANDTKSAAESICNLLADIPFSYFEYNHTTGENNLEERIIRQPKMLIIEGLHAFHPDILPYLDYKIFIKGSKEVLNALRYTNNIHKRKMTPSAAAQNLQKENALYESCVLPYLELADRTITVEEQWQYHL